MTPKKHRHANGTVDVGRDGDDFYAELRDKHCSRCPAQILCRSGAWPDGSYRCARCKCVHAGGYPLARCLQSTIEGRMKYHVTCYSAGGKCPKDFTDIHVGLLIEDSE